MGYMMQPQSQNPDPEAINIRSRGYLPHWTAQDGTYFVTFRLFDSLPRSVLDDYKFERENIIITAKQIKRKLTDAEKQRVKELYEEKIERSLDARAGACYLHNPKIAGLIADALRHFHGTRYQLFAWCVMPNHVHVLVQPAAGHELEDILHTWKSYTAHEANKILKRTGAFWQREYYDHLIRNEEDFVNHIDYVLKNPSVARLKDWKWIWSAFSDCKDDFQLQRRQIS
ncbi:transposase [Candidatus Sumerlaeota bacterium]|nr:transposase [Candidatus Sumerlaeota bacterium]